MSTSVSVKVRKTSQLFVTTVFLLMSVFVSPLGTSASGLTLNWYSNYDYSDGQSLAFSKRLIVSASSASIGTGFAMWCVAVDGQPFAMQGTSSINDDFTNVYLYFERGVVTRSVTVQSENGCWRVADASLEDRSTGFDITVPLKTLALGSRTITLTGHHRNGGTASKSIIINKIAPPERPLTWVEFTATGWGGPSHYTDGQTITGRKRLIVSDTNLRSGFYNYGYLRWCLTLNGQPLIMRETAAQGLGGLATVYLRFDRGGITQQNAQTSGGCWVIADRDLEYSSNGIDLTINTTSWPDGQYTLEIVGYHKTEAIGTKTLTFNTTNTGDRLSVGRGVTAASGTATIPVTYSRMSPQDRVCLKRNGSVVDSTIKLDSQGPDANGCWQRTLPSGTRTLNFTANTLAWVDGSYSFEVSIPADYPEVGSATATITSTNPSLAVTASGIGDNEQVSGPRQVTIGAQIAAVHSAQIKPSKYCLDLNNQTCAFTSTTDAASATYTLVSHAYPDGPHRLTFKATDSAGREATKAVSFQIANGKPVVSGGTATTKAPNAPKGKASATISFNAPKATAATVELSESKGRPQRADIDLLSSLDGSATASFENLKPSTKYNFRVTSRNANGESRAITGTFTTPAAPKPAPRAGSSSSGRSGGSSAVYCPIVIAYRLDRAESALRSAGCSPYSVPASGCKALFGIVNRSNWFVVGQRGSTLYACQR